MGRSAVAISEKIMHLSEAQLAELDKFVESLRLSNSPRTADLSSLSEPSFATVWSNPEDDVYDAPDFGDIVLMQFPFYQSDRIQAEVSGGRKESTV